MRERHVHQGGADKEWVHEEETTRKHTEGRVGSQRVGRGSTAQRRMG